VAEVRIQAAASHRLDEICRYPRDTWGEAHADRYITGLFAAFAAIESRGVRSQPIPAAFGVHGYVFRYAHHFVYWRHLEDGAIGIVTILHERMHQFDRFREDFGLES
jgi:toxin ParE1/3/4